MNIPIKDCDSNLFNTNDVICAQMNCRELSPAGNVQCYSPCEANSCGPNAECSQSGVDNGCLNVRPWRQHIHWSHNLNLLLFANAYDQRDIYSKYNCACDGSAWVTKGDSCVATIPNWLIIFIPSAFIMLILTSCLVYRRLRQTMKPDETNA